MNNVETKELRDKMRSMSDALANNAVRIMELEACVRSLECDTRILRRNLTHAEGLLTQEREGQKGPMISFIRFLESILGALAGKEGLDREGLCRLQGLLKSLLGSMQGLDDSTNLHQLRKNERRLKSENKK